MVYVRTWIVVRLHEAHMWEIATDSNLLSLQQTYMMRLFLNLSKKSSPSNL